MKNQKPMVIKNTNNLKSNILSLKQNDKIFGLRLSFGGHRLEEPKELNGEVDIVDYCEITSMDLRGNSDDFRVGISHDEVPFGLTTTLNKKEYMCEHCLLSINTMKTGYDSFYTLKPESWKEDLIRMFNKNTENRKKHFEIETDILKSKVDLFIESGKKINKIMLTT